MTQKRLNGLAELGMYCDIARKPDFSRPTIIYDFAGKSQ